MSKKFVTICISIIFILTLFPQAYVSAADLSPADGSTVDLSTCSEYDTITINNDYHVTITGQKNNIGIVCEGNVTLTLQSVMISNVSSSPHLSPITFTGTGNKMLLEGVSVLSAGLTMPAIRVEGTAELIIDSDTNGVLTANGGNGGAGIGGKFYISVGTITIAGGTITANGGVHNQEETLEKRNKEQKTTVIFEKRRRIKEWRSYLSFRS